MATRKPGTVGAWTIETIEGANDLDVVVRKGGEIVTRFRSIEEAEAYIARAEGLVVEVEEPV